MKTSFLPGLRMSLAATALVFAPLCAGVAEEPYGGNNPKIGTRILNFFKDIAQGESPMSRYRQEPPPPPPSRQRGGAGPRYSLDAPPPAGAYEDRDSQPLSPGPGQPALPPSPLQPPPQETPPASPSGRDMPYESPPAPSEPPLRRPADTVTPKSRPDPAPPSRPTRTDPARDTSPVEITSAPEPPAAPKKTPPKVEDRPSDTPLPKPGDAPDPATTSPSTPPPGPPPADTSTSPLVGTKTGKPGRVKSPYPPYNELDVTGLESGSLAMDPTTKKVFRVP